MVATALFTADEFRTMFAAGAFDDMAIELVRGELHRSLVRFGEALAVPGTSGTIVIG